jgi:hypothetical protein
MTASIKHPHRPNSIHGRSFPMQHPQESHAHKKLNSRRNSFAGVLHGPEFRSISEQEQRKLLTTKAHRPSNVPEVPAAHLAASRQRQILDCLFHGIHYRRSGVWP